MDLPFPLLLALRTLRSTRRDAFASFLSAVAGGGIALGVAALILALAALSGFQRALKGEVLARTPALEVTLPDDADLAAARIAVEALSGVTSVQATVRGRGWLLAGAKVRAAEVVGFDGIDPLFFPDSFRFEDTAATAGAFVPHHLASIWGLSAGEVLELVSPRPTLGPLGPQPRNRRVPLVGTYRSGRTEDVERVAVPFEVAAALFGRSATRLVVATTDLTTADRLVEPLIAILPAGSTVASWRSLNRPLFFALRLEKSLTFVAVALIVLVAALALVADLALIIASKRRELGMLAAMGATPAALRRAYLICGSLLALGGALLGGSSGLALAWVLDRKRLVKLPGEAYFLDYVPFAVELSDLAWVAVTAVGLALVCAAIGASRVTALDPIEALRGSR